MKPAFLVVLFLVSMPALAEDLRLRVDAGSHDRFGTPVWADVPLAEDLASRASAVAEAGGRVQPAAVVRVGDGKARLAWIVEKLPAGESRVYTLRVSEKVDARAPAFRWRESESEGLDVSDLLLGKRPVVRYVHTPFDPDDVELTKKPFHHVYSPSGDRLITKGPGGRYPHHRGIFFGYNKCRVGGETYDIWHAKRGEHQVHVETLEEIAGPVAGGHSVKVHWNDREGKPFALEVRRLVAWDTGNDDTMLVDFSSRLGPTAGPVKLEGDLQHAGVQFRAAQYVADHSSETTYLRPEKWKELPEDRELGKADRMDLPWNALRMNVDGQPCTVAYLSHPENPDGAEFSERRYGRFGEYFPWELREDNPLEIRYRFFIVEGHDASREEIERRYADFADPPEVRIARAD